MNLTPTLLIQIVADILLFYAGFRYWKYPTAPWHHVGWIGMGLWLFQ